MDFRVFQESVSAVLAAIRGITNSDSVYILSNFYPKKSDFNNNHEKLYILKANSTSFNFHEGAEIGVSSSYNWVLNHKKHLYIPECTEKRMFKKFKKSMLVAPICTSSSTRSLIVCETKDLGYEDSAINSTLTLAKELESLFNVYRNTKSNSKSKILSYDEFLYACTKLTDQIGLENLDILRFNISLSSKTEKSVGIKNINLALERAESIFMNDFDFKIPVSRLYNRDLLIGIDNMYSHQLKKRASSLYGFFADKYLNCGKLKLSVSLGNIKSCNKKITSISDLIPTEDDIAISA